jgi:hypothetical protein
MTHSERVHLCAEFKTGILAVPTDTGGLGDSYGIDDHYWLLFNSCCHVLFFILVYDWSCGHGIYATLKLINANPVSHLKAKCSLTSVSFLSLMNPLLYLLSTTCTHPCYFTTPQVGHQIRNGMTIIAMSIRLVVCQSTCPCYGASAIESY